MNNEQIRFIDRLYKDLYLDESVIHHGSGNKYDKFNNIKAYLQKLESIHTKVSDTDRHKELLRRMYHDKYVIKVEDIPESYYKHQQEIALERGYGHIEVTEEMKKQYEEQIINDQKASLDVWLSYFISEDAKVYPFWAKYWAFQGMLKLGSYYKEKGEFGRRTKDTVSPFVDLNREALALSIDMIIKLLNKEQIEDKNLEVLVKSGSFGKIYSYVITNVLKDNTNITKRNIGRWIKYDQGSDHMILVNSLKGYNTGWCTAGESTAKEQLANGDFYVYYTLDENNQYKVPRIAIRMEYNKIAEIRGIAKDQNLESEMEEIVDEKLKEFPDKGLYYKKVSDMKELTKIYKKHKNKEELTEKELRFLYEINNQIIGFGYSKDPRLSEIINERNKREDLSFVFNCSVDQIALEETEIKDDTVFYIGDLVVRNLTSIEGLVLPRGIGGDLILSNLTSAKGLVLPQTVGGNLELNNITSSEGLVLPESVGGILFLGSLTSAEGLVLPKNVGNSLDLGSLTNVEGLVLPENMLGSLYLDSLTSTEGLILPKNIGQDLQLMSLTSAEGLILPENIGGSLILYSLENVKDLLFPEYIGQDLHLNSLTSAEDLVLPKYIGNSLDLGGLIGAKGLVLPENIGCNLLLYSLANAKGLVLPKNIGAGVYFDALSIDDITIPTPLTYNIYMKGFEITPQNVHKYRKNYKKLHKHRNNQKK